MTYTVDGTMFVNMLGGGVKTLDANRQIVNDLNVFPIPDGDTGDNMLSTISSGFDAVAGSHDETLEEVAARAASGMLLGARGNSGVILSRIFAGIAAGFTGTVTADAKGLGKALECGVKEAYKAVSEPVEGTMLTVIRESVERANEETTDATSLDAYFDTILAEVKNSLKRTPELLPVLKEAGVVDSGGAGLMYIIEGMVKVLRGEFAQSSGMQSAGSVDGSHGARTESAANAPDLSKFTEDSELKFGYCTEFLLRLQRSKVDLETFDVGVLSKYLSDVGESVVCFRDGSIIKVHVHTMTPGNILNYAQQFGEFLTLKIENMTLQHNENMEGVCDPEDDGNGAVGGNAGSGSESAAADFELRTKPHKKFATVTVAAGEGIKDTFASLGVDAVIDGGQSMNPSAADFLKAFRTIQADNILVFPNNSNIILTAKQAAELYMGSKVFVVNTRSIGAGYSALSMLDVSSGDPEQIVAQCEEVGDAAVTAHVAPASRDTVIDGIEVRKDEYLGFTDELVYACEKDRGAAALKLCEALEAGACDVVLVIGGAAVGEEEAADLLEKLESTYKRTEFIYIDGGQPVYDYILIFE